jgi:hypothetical protein
MWGRRVLYLFVFLIVVGGFAQDITENPERPLNRKAGRILKLEQVMRIESEGEGYYLSSPSKLEFDHEGNLYVRDVTHSNAPPNFFKFSPSGRFLKKLLRQGEGPGEIQSMFHYAISDNEIHAMDMMRPKIVMMDLNGEFIREYKLEGDTFNSCLGLWDGKLALLKMVPPYERKTSRLYDDEMKIVLVSDDGKTREEVHSFQRKSFYISLAQGGGWKDWDPFISVLGENGRLYVCHTQEYMIEVLDLKTRGIVQRFRRKFPRVRYNVRPWESEFAKKFGAPIKKYDNDIRDLMLNGRTLWVKTSAVIDGKGTLYDIYDPDGKYADSFYVDLPGSVLRIAGEFLFTVETDAESLPYIAKYKILN